MRFLFLLGALLVLFAGVAYSQGEDYQGKRGKHGFLQGKRGKHGFLQGKRGKHGFLQGKRGKHGFLQELFGNEDSQATMPMGGGFCGHCRGFKHDSNEDYQGKRGKHGFDLYQGKRGKHGFLQGKRGKHGFVGDTGRDMGSTVCSNDSDCGDGWCCNEDNPDYDYQGKRGKHGFDLMKYYQGKRGKHGFLQGKRGKHGFVGDEEDPLYSSTTELYGFDMGEYDVDNYNKHGRKCSTDSDCGGLGSCCNLIGFSLHGTCGFCTDDNPDDDYQGKRGKHGFLQGKRGKHGFFSGGEDYQGKRGKHGFFSAGEDYQGKRGKHGFF